MTVCTKDGLTRQTYLWRNRAGKEWLVTWEYKEGADLSDMANWRLLK